MAEKAHHGPSLKVYFAIFFALMILTALTVKAAFTNFGTGPLGDIIAMGIAGTKATLVVLFFMHVKYESKLTQLFAGAGFFWLLILAAFLGIDYVSRDWMPIAGW